MDKKISGEHLAVMGVAAKVEIHTGICCFCQFFGLVVDKYDRFALVQCFGKLGRSFSGTFYFVAA